MAQTIVIGDGPGGLSAALFLAKAGESVTVVGKDATAMHHAYLYNYLGIEQISGTDLQAVGRAQVTGFGGSIVDAEVTTVQSRGEGFVVSLEGGDDLEGDYLVLGEGRNPALARGLGLSEEGGAIVTDREGRSSNDRVYVIGRSARPERSQAIISAGAGAVAALDVISRERGGNYHDWDTPD